MALVFTAIRRVVRVVALVLVPPRRVVRVVALVLAPLRRVVRVVALVLVCIPRVVRVVALVLAAGLGSFLMLPGAVGVILFILDPPLRVTCESLPTGLEYAGNRPGHRDGFLDDTAICPGIECMGVPRHQVVCGAAEPGCERRGRHRNRFALSP